MEGDTPSSSAAALAMDAIDSMRRQSGHAHTQSQLSGVSHFDEEDLRRYFIASPQSQTGELTATTPASLAGLFGGFAGLSPASTGGVGQANAPSNSQQQQPPTLEGALAALGDQGRQQLLAILQLASGSQQQQQQQAQQQVFPGMPSSSQSASHGPTSAFSFPGHGLSTASASSESPGNGGAGSSSQQAAPPSNNSNNGTPAYFHNAFQRYSAHAPSPNTVPPTYSAASTPASASNSSAKPSPALSAVAQASSSSHSGGHHSVHNMSHSLNGHSAASKPSAFHQPQQQPTFTAGSRSLPVNATSEAFSYPLPKDTAVFRSPAPFSNNHSGIPGTSSSAFYSDAGTGEDNDLLFTPLMSPALTASTQPGPSVGPLPESFANLSTQQFSQYKHLQDPQSTSQGISPMTLFSPLTSPALGPQGGHAQLHAQATHLQNNGQVTSPPRSTSNSQSSGKIRGASKKMSSKTRPSPIIRPTVDTSNLGSSSNFGPKSASSTHGSKRQHHNGGHHSTSASHSRSGSLNGFSQPQSSFSNPASPAFYPAHMNASMSSLSSFGSSKATNGTASSGNANSNASRSHEITAQAAIQESPSPHQFDLSGVISAAMGNLQQYPSANEQQQHQQSQHQHHHQSQEHQQPGFGLPQQYQNMLPNGSFAPSGPGSEGLVGQPQLDFNTVFNMLAQSNGFGGSNNTFGPNNQGASTAPSAMQQPTAQPMDLSSVDAFLRQSAASLQQFSAAAPSQDHRSAGATQASQMPYQQGAGYNSAALTPAAFMNMPPDQYSLLSGLFADHQPMNQQPVKQQASGRDHIAASSAPASRQASKQNLAAQSRTDGKQHDWNNDHGIGQSRPTTSQQLEPSSSKQTLSEPSRTYLHGEDAQMHSAIASNATVPVSPALLAQNIKQVAAAAIAAKDAKSRAKGRGAARRKSSGQQQADGMDVDSAADKKKSKRNVSGQNSDGLASPDKPFSLDDAPSAAPSVYGESAPASTETSPMLAPQPDSRKSSHKVAEQRRRDSLKLCFEELRFILPPINPDEDEDFNGGPGSRRPGENNVGGQRGKNYIVDPRHPNKGISKVALLRKSNEYVTKLHDRVDRRDAAINMLREELRLCRVALGQGLPGDDQALDALSNVQFDELEEDNDVIPPTYRLHGLHAPGSKLSLSAAFAYRPSESAIPEEAERDDEDEDDQEEDGDADYKAKKAKRGSTAAPRVNTRKTGKASAA